MTIPAVDPGSPTPPSPVAAGGQGFEAIPYPVRSFGGLGTSQYLIYTSKTEFSVVEAETAAEALQNSGVNNAVKIIRNTPGRDVLIDLGKMSNTN